MNELIEVFRRQAEARDYVRNIEDDTERILLETAVSRAISFLIGDQEYIGAVTTTQMDLYDFARAVHAWIKLPGLLKVAVNGNYKSTDELTLAIGLA